MNEGKKMRNALWARGRTNTILLVLLVIGGYFLLTEHWAHVIQALPYLLVLGCIVMHLFMHGGHGHGDEGGLRQQDRPDWRGDRR